MTNEELLQLIEQATRERRTTLDLRFQGLSLLPTEIGQLTNLTELNLTGNHLDTIPPEICQLTKLKQLYLSGNQLTLLPPEIGRLINLEVFSLSHNLLMAQLSSEIGKLINLIRLDLSYNKLTLLPPNIGYLTKLMRLDLSNNDLTNLPEEIGQLKNLLVLYLDSTQLTKLPPSIGQLTKLTMLYLSCNRLKTLPSSIGQLPDLTILDLHKNRLTQLPAEIGNLIKLRELNLSNNKLTKLPKEIGKLTNLVILELTGNSLGIPPEILRKKDVPAIINYYLQHQAGQRKPLNEVKLLLVGQGSVGKTSLIKRLIENRFNPTEDKTEGINITKWPITIHNQQIRLNVWDFGGQEIMHATHQFFLTKRSLYLLVLDARLGEEENRLEYWLKMIGSFGGESPVIVVGNKIDQQPLDLDKRGLMLKYPQIRAIVETSCLDGRGLDELRATIEREIVALPHLNDQLLLGWFNIKTQLEQMDRDYLPYHEYLYICQSEGVSDDLSQRTLIGFLHDLGIVLNFQDDPRLEETNILNPEWVTSGVYKILNDDTLLTQHHGVLERAMLSRILDPRRYPRDKHLFIMDMMRKFELCFDFEGFADRKFLIPDLLPKEEPETGDWSNALAFQYHYPILPGSVISRFIVRMNHLIHRHTYWRNGVVLAHEGNTALIKADREDRKIFIWVSGPESSRRRFLVIIRAEFDAIHSTIPGLEVSEKVPLPDHPEIVVDYQDLRNLEEMGEPYLVVPSLRQRFGVKALLDGVDEPLRRETPNRYSFEDRPVLSRKEELQRLIVNSLRRLQKLKEEEALKGRSASLSLEIEDIESELEKLQTELREIE